MELPGTNSRLREPKVSHMQTLVGQVAAGLRPYLEPGQPPVLLWGHSMGAWIAFELARAMAAPGSGLQPPARLFASANRAPSLAGREHNPDHHVMHQLDDSSFWRVCEQRYGPNPDLEHPALRKLLLPGMRADFRLLETYEPQE